MVRCITAVLSVVLLVGLVVAWPVSGHLSAQEEEPTEPVAEEATEVPPTLVPTATPSAYPLRSLAFTLLAQADISMTTSGPVVVSAATVSIQPQSATVTFVTEGDTIISASLGTVSIDADQGVLGVADIGASIGLDTVSGTPVALDSVNLGVGGQVFLPAGTTTTIRNDTEAAATLLILTIVPAP